MSTPMFIREPTANAINLAGTGVATEIVPAVAEATLIEELLYAATDGVQTNAGILEVWFNADPEIAGAHIALAGSYQIAPAAAALPATGRLTLNITLPVGWALQVGHDTQKTAGGDALMSFTAIGGIVR